jgi:hypothetical protein
LLVSIIALRPLMGRDGRTFAETGSYTSSPRWCNYQQPPQSPPSSSLSTDCNYSSAYSSTTRRNTGRADSRVALVVVHVGPSFGGLRRSSAPGARYPVFGPRGVTCPAAAGRRRQSTATMSRSAGPRTSFDRSPLWPRDSEQTRFDDDRQCH